MSTDAILLPTHTPELFQAAVRHAAALLRAGELVAVPTETVYGLAANALNAQAVEKIFAVKGRPTHNPIIVHVAGEAMARRCVSDWPLSAHRLAAAFWPGPLTLVLPRSAQIPDAVTAGGGTVGVRWPSHPFMQALIRECDFPLAAPSANPSNRISPTTAEHVRKSLGQAIRLIVDGGPSQVGIESTVVDLVARPPRVLRPGMIHEESLAAALGEPGTRLGSGRADVPPGALRSPGQLPQHYSPRARLVLRRWQDETDLLRQVCDAGWSPGTVHVIAHTRIPLTAAAGLRVSVIPHDAEAFARAIYAELHRADDEGAQVIVIEQLPEGPAWQAIQDRLERAAH